MQKGFSVPLLLGGVLIAALLFGWYLLNSLNKGQQSNNFSLSPVDSVEKKNNLYTNSSLGFEFQYPDDKGWTVLEDSEEGFNKRGNGDFRKNFTGYVGYEPGKLLGATVVLNNENNFDTSPLTVWVFDNPDNLSVDGWFDRYWYYPFLWGVFDPVSKGHVVMDQEATVSGQIAKYKIISYQIGSPKYVYLSNNGKIYLFRIIGEIGDQILQSFKLLE